MKMNERPPGSKMGLLRNRLFVRVYSAYAAAAFGDWFDMLAIQVLVGYRWQASPLMLALIPVAIALPNILLGSVAGVAADRLNKVWLMRLCDIITAMMTLLILLVPNMAMLLPLLVLRSAAGTLNVPAQQSLTRQLVREDQLMHAASLNGLVNQGSKIAGPLLGGMALSFLSPHWCILLGALLRIGSLGILCTVPARAGEKKQQADGEKEDKLSLTVMWKEGWRFLFRSRLLLSTMLFGLCGSLIIQLVDFQFTSLFRLLAPDQEAMLGLMVAAAGAGAVTVISFMGHWNKGGGYGWKLGLGDVLIGVAIAGLGLLPQGTGVLPVLALGFLMGMGNGIFMITFQYCLQRETPSHMTGRVFGIQSTVLGVVMVASPLIGGGLVQMAGPSAIFMTLGVVISALGVAGIALARVLWPQPKEHGTEQKGEITPAANA